MKTKTWSVKTKFIDAYKENVTILREPRCTKMDWVTSLKKVGEPNHYTEQTDRFVLVDLGRTKASQIQVCSEEIEQENRRLRIQLSEIKDVHDLLQSELEDETLEIEELRKRYDKQKQKIYAFSNFPEQDFLLSDHVKKEDNFNHLQKNLCQQIRSAELEAKKNKVALKQLREGERFSHFSKLLTAKNEYQNEIKKVNRHLTKKESVEPKKLGIDKKKCYSLKINTMNEKLAKIKKHITNVDKDLENAQEFFQKASNFSESAKKISNLKSKETIEAEKELELVDSELIEFQKKINALQKEADIFL